MLKELELGLKVYYYLEKQQIIQILYFVFMKLIFQIILKALSFLLKMQWKLYLKIKFQNKDLRMLTI